MYQKSEGASAGVAQVLTATHPEGSELSSWNWDYPVGAGDYYSLYPKSWYDYKWEKFPAHVTLEQFSPILPDNYKESSYPIAVYRWHAENTTDTAVTVSVMLSWQNLLGAFRTFGSNFAGGQAAGNFNKFVTEPSAGGSIKGIVFDRERPKEIANEWDGQWVIATEEAAGTEVSYQTTWATGAKGPDTAESLWQSFAKDGNLPNSDRTWISSGEQINGAIAIKFTLKPGEKRTVPHGYCLGHARRAVRLRPQVVSPLHRIFQ
jgi:non-lysosomal glucosylceramidase